VVVINASADEQPAGVIGIEGALSQITTDSM
jgi:hypothetical protein